MSALPSRQPIRVAAVVLLALACWGCVPAADEPEAAEPNVTASAVVPAQGTLPEAISGARAAEPAATVPTGMPPGLPTPVTGQSEPATPSARTATPTATPSATPSAPPARQTRSASPAVTPSTSAPQTEPPEPAPQTPEPAPLTTEPSAPAAPTGQPASPPPATIAEPDSLRRALTVFYIAIDDGGTSGPLVGCGDSAVPTTTVPVSFGNQVQASIEALLADDATGHGEAGLSNTLQPSTLVFVSSFVQGDTVTVMLSGRVVSGGMCDDPRIEAQLAYTAKVAAGVGRAEIYVDGTPIGRLLGGK